VNQDPMDALDRLLPWIIKGLIVVVLTMVLGLLIPQSIIEWRKAMTYRAPTDVHDLTIREEK